MKQLKFGVKTAQYLPCARKNTLPLTYENFKDEIINNFNDKDGYYLSNSKKDFHCQYWVELTNEYLWVFALSGKTKPHGETLLDVETEVISKNTRSINQVEMNKPHFILITFNQNRIYTSPNDGVLLEELFVSKIFHKTIEIKQIFVEGEVFIDRLKEIQEISFWEEPTSFWNQNGWSRPMLQDFIGDEIPEKFQLSIKGKILVKKSIKEFLFGAISQNQKGATRNLIIRGRDEDNFTKVFNTNELSAYIVINSAPDENGTYSFEEVKNIKTLLLGRIKNEKTC